MWQIFSTFFIARVENLSWWEISPQNRYSPHFHCPCRKICHVEKFLHMIDLLYISHCSCGDICHVETCIHMTDFSTFLHKTHFAPHFSCGELSLCDRFVFTFLMWRNFSTWQSVIWKHFFTWRIFSPQALLVVLVTNIRYDYDWYLHDA